MKLILRADVEALGNLGDIVTVKAGYGRNYLVPQGLAMPATEGNLKQFEVERKKLEAQADSLRAEARDLAEKIAATPLEIVVRVGEGDKLYGSVTSANIGDAMAEKGVDIDRRKILLAEPIRSLGEYVIEVRLHPDVVAELKLFVLRKGQTVEDLQAAAAEAEAPAEAAEAAPEASEEAADAEQAESEQPAEA